MKETAQNMPQIAQTADAGCAVLEAQKMPVCLDLFFRLPNGPWLNPDQAVVYLGLPSRKALYQSVRRGQIPAHRLGRRLRFNRGELDALLSEHSTIGFSDPESYHVSDGARLPEERRHDR